MTLSAHEFLHHGRSRPPSLMTAAARRWGVWARSIKARHGLLVAARHRGVSMTLFAPSYALNLSSRRWQMNAWSLFPRINLTVAPLLSRLAPQGFIKRRAEVAQARAAVHDDRRAEVMRSPGSQVGTLARGGDAAHAPAPQSDWENAALMARRRVNGRVDEQTDAREVAPLQRVFRRAEAGEAQWHHQTAALVSGPLSVARRVTEEKRRVEQQARGATVMQQRTQSKREGFERDDATASGDRRRPGGFDLARDATTAAARAAPPALNIQQLTDEVVRQIDSRIVAHKERMGKLF